jgi:hypothetical protein
MVTEMPEGLYQDWHPPPGAQLLVVLSGTLEVETSDGKKHRCSSGGDDVGSRGNRTAQSAARPGCCSFICRPKPISALDRFRSFALTPGLRFMQIYPDTPRPDHIRSLQKFEKVG